MPTLWQPDALHRIPARGPWFEGWYHKVVSPDGHALAIIPGVYVSGEADVRHAFVMVVDGATGTERYVEFGLGELSAAPDHHDLRLGPNRFHVGGLELALETDDLHLHGTVEYVDVSPWPVTWASPGAMGPYAFAPFMQCFHGVPSLDHALAGRLVLDGTPIPLDGGRGYVEKDWGRGFPDAWVWCQCNHFEAEGTSLMVSIATIPWILGREFAGALVALWHGGELYRFTTYTGARVRRFDVGDERVHLTFEGPRHRLEVQIVRGTRTALLHAPDRVGMVAKVPEALDARVHVALADRAGRVLWEGDGEPAALEVMGDQARLAGMLGV